MNVSIQHIKDPRRKTASGRANLRLKSTKLAYEQGVVHAKLVKHRVVNEGRFPDRWPFYESRGRRKGPYLVIQEYADAAGLAYTEEQVWKNGRGESLNVVEFSNSSDAHRGVESRTYKVTGGMWDGLGVQRTGRGRAKVAFFGRSKGRNIDEAKRNAARLQKGQPVRAAKVSNAKKAGAVYVSHRVHLLKLFEAERAQLRAGRRYVLRSWVDKILGIDPPTPGLGKYGFELVRRYGRG